MAKKYKNRLYTLRHKFQLSKAEVCEKVNISQKALYNYEHCLRAIPSDVLIRFAEFYRCTTDHILCFKADIPEETE